MLYFNLCAFKFHFFQLPLCCPSGKYIRNYNCWGSGPLECYSCLEERVPVKLSGKCSMLSSPRLGRSMCDTGLACLIECRGKVWMLLRLIPCESVKRLWQCFLTIYALKTPPPPISKKWFHVPPEAILRRLLLSSIHPSRKMVFDLCKF